MKQMNDEWQRLVERRVDDALRRSLVRGCGAERKDLLLREAKALLVQQNFRCALCGTQLTASANAKRVASLDRIFSSVKPSPTRESKCGYLHNCRWVCYSCNHATRSCHMPRAKWKHPKCSE